MFKSLRTIISVLFASILLLSSTTGSFAIDKLHFVIGGGAGGGWDGTATVSYTHLRAHET